jgi:hypothetical protein
MRVSINLVVDGHEFADSESNWAGDGKYPPFAVFDVDFQTNLLPYYATRKQAEQAMLRIARERVDELCP